MTNVPSNDGQHLIFRSARSHSVWLDKQVDDALLKQVYELGDAASADQRH